MVDLVLYKTSLRDVIRPRRLLGAAPLIALPALLVLFWRVMARSGSFQPETAYNLLAGGPIFSFTLVILAVLFGTGVLSQEIEGRTIHFLLTRPVPRARILLARFLGAFTGITLAVWLSILLLAAAAFGPLELLQPAVRRDLLVVPLGALAYGGLFLMVATLLPRPILYGLFFAFGWESWVPLLPGSMKNVSLMTYLRTLAPHTLPESDAEGPGELLQALSPTDLPTGVALGVLAGVVIVTLGVALLVFSQREYVPRDDAE